MDSYLLLKLIHLLSAVVVLGTGAGIAFFMLMASRSHKLEVIVATTRSVVLADWVFTAPAVLLQLLTGVALMWKLGYSFSSPWALSVFLLYAIVACCWLPVIVIQYKLREIAEISMQQKKLQAAFGRWMRLWVALGVPAFLCVLLLFYLMVFKPFSVL